MRANLAFFPARAYHNDPNYIVQDREAIIWLRGAGHGASLLIAA
jgi:hypothetical protein